VQQYRSTFLAQPRRRIVLEGDDGGEGEPSVAMTMGAASGRACGACGAVVCVARRRFCAALICVTSPEMAGREDKKAAKGTRRTSKPAARLVSGCSDAQHVSRNTRAKARVRQHGIGIVRPQKECCAQANARWSGRLRFVVPPPLQSLAVVVVWRRRPRLGVSG